MEQRHPRQDQLDRQAPGRGRPANDAGFSMIATVLALVVAALAVALLLGTTLHSGGTSSGGTATGPGVAAADRAEAQQSLSTGLDSAQTVASTAGGFSGVTASALQASNPSITFVDGSSSGPTTVSVAISTNGGGGTVGGSGGGSGSSGDPSSGDTGVPSIPGVGGGGTGGVPGGGSGTGSDSLTLADRSSDGVCWLVWKSTESATWYGAQTGLASCTAPQLSAPPTSGPVSGGSIGWQQGGFPSP